MSTIRDVAKAADVSIATVSRILNNDTTYKVTEATRKKVLKAAKDLNYLLPASSAGSSASKKVGCILCITRKRFDDPYFLSILSAAEDYFRLHDCEISFVRSGSDIEEDISIITNANNLDGLLIMEEVNDSTYSEIRKVVPNVIGIDTHYKDIDNVAYDHYGVAKQATEYLIQKGHTKIGFIGGHGYDLKQSLRYQGYQSAMHCAGLEIMDSWEINSGWNEDICAEKIEELFKSDNTPTAFFAASDLMAMAAISKLHGMGIDVPGEVAIIGLSDIDIANFSTPPLTTFHVPTEEIGKVAADMLLKRIKGYDSIPLKIILPCSIVERQSV